MGRNALPVRASRPLTDRGSRRRSDARCPPCPRARARCSTCLTDPGPMGAEGRHGSARRVPWQVTLTFAIQVGAKQVFRPKLAPGEAERAGSEGRSGHDHGFVRASPCVASGCLASHLERSVRPNPRQGVATRARFRRLVGEAREPRDRQRRRAVCRRRPRRQAMAPRGGDGRRGRRAIRQTSPRDMAGVSRRRRKGARKPDAARARPLCSAGGGRVDMTGGRFHRRAGPGRIDIQDSRGACVIRRFPLLS